MGKVTFQNLPSTNTPVNATNLNDIQEYLDYKLEKVNISISANSSKTLTFTTSSFAGIFMAKGTNSGANNCTLIFTYGEGGERTKTSQLYTGSGHLSFTANGQALTISNSGGVGYSCALICVVGSHSSFTVS